MRLSRRRIGRVPTNLPHLFVYGCVALIIATSTPASCSAEAAPPELTTKLQTLGIRVVESVPSDTTLRVVFEKQQGYDEMMAACLVLTIAAEYAPEDGSVEAAATRDSKLLFQVQTPAAKVGEFVKRSLSKRQRTLLQQLLTQPPGEEITKVVRRPIKEIIVNPSAEKPPQKKVQTSAEDIARALVALDLENVQVAWQYNGDLNVQFENRTYRSDATALGKVLETIAAIVEPKTRVNVLVLRDEVVVGRFSIRADAYQKFRADEISIPEVRQELQADLDLWEFTWPEAIREGTGRLNPSRGRFDLLLRPGLEYSIGGELDPWESTPLLRPELTVGLGDGLRAAMRGRVVLDEWGWSIDRALITKTKRMHSPNLLWTASTGKFRHSRYGGFLEGQWVDGRDRTRLGARLAVLGLDFGDRDFEMRTGYIEREFGRVGLTARATYGTFLELGQRGYLVELERRFGESTLSLGGTAGIEPRRLLVRVSVPFGGAKQGEPRDLRVRTNPALELDYVSSILPSGDTLWDAPDLRDLRGELTLPYTSSHPERLVEGMVSPVREDEWKVAPSFEGLSGLIRTPTADVIPDGHYVLGSSWIPKAYTSGMHQGKSKSRPTYTTVGFLPNLELNFRFTFYDDVPSVFSGIVTHWPYDLDRCLSAQYRLWRQEGGRPALAIGAQDMQFGDDAPKVGRAEYVVASHQFDDLRLHLGVGTGRYRGLFAGIEARLSDHTKLIAEYDTNDVNLGLRMHLSSHLTLDAAWLDTADFGAAVNYQGALP